jgi:hypothetical protein
MSPARWQRSLLTAVAAVVAVMATIGHPAPHRTAGPVEHRATLTTVGAADSLPAVVAQHRAAERPAVGGSTPQAAAIARPPLASKPAAEPVSSLSRHASSRPGIRAPPA